jgi:hypothetical protein
VTTNAPATRTQAVMPPIFHEVVGRSADVLYTIARYQEMGALMSVERLDPVVPGEERARIHLLVGTPILPVGPEYDREQWEIGDYFIASLMVLRYLLYASLGGGALWVIYHIYLGIAAVFDWFGVHSAVMASSITGIATLAVLVFLLALLKGGGKGCAGIHCGGCRG